MEMNVIYEVLSGSRAYGLATETADEDIRGIFLPTERQLLGFGYRETVERKPDVVHHSLKKFLSLALKANPSILAWLWVPAEHVRVDTTLGWILRLNRDRFLSRKVRDTFGGYAMSQLKKMEKSYGAERGYALHGERDATGDPYSQRAGYDCYAEDETEFLTTRGWLRFDQILADDKVGTLDIQSGRMIFQSPIARIDRMYTGLMYLLEPYSSRTMITPKHNLLVSPMHRSKATQFSTQYVESTAEWQFKSMEDILLSHRSHFYIRRAPDKREEETVPVDDDYLRLAGLYVADGTSQFRGGRFKAIALTQSKKESAFYAVINHLSTIYPIKRYDYQKETRWQLSGDIAYSIYREFGHGSKRKRLPQWCFMLSARQAEILWLSLLAGDGTDKPLNQTYYTSNEALAGDIQATMVSAGLVSTVYGPYRSISTFGVSYMYHVVRPKKTGSVSTLYAKQILNWGQVPKHKKGYPIKEIRVSNKRVVCLEVPNGTLITRSKGKVAIQGNCKNAQHLIRLLYCGILLLQDHQYPVYIGDDRVRKHLLAIRHGEVAFNEILSEARVMFDWLDYWHDRSSLPNEPDTEWAENFLIDAHRSVIVNSE